MSKFLVYSAGKKIDLPSQVFELEFLDGESDLFLPLLKTKKPILLLDETFFSSKASFLISLHERVKDLKVILLVEDKNKIEGHLSYMDKIEAIIEKSNDMAIRKSIFDHFHLFDLFGVLEQRLIKELEVIMEKKLQLFSFQSVEEELKNEFISE